MTYRVKNWENLYENSESKKLKHARYVLIPNKHDGKGFKRLASHPKKVEILAGWTLILQIASKMPNRGELRDEDGDLTAEDMSYMTSFPEKIFEITLEVLSDEKIGWIEKMSNSLDTPDNPLDSPDDSRDEGKGREGNRIEEKDPPLPPKGDEKKGKHSFKNSPYFDFQILRDSLPEWSEEKVKHYHQAAFEYSGSKGAKYLDWRLAIMAWDRKKPYNERTNGGQRQQRTFQQIQDDERREALERDRAIIERARARREASLHPNGTEKPPLVEEQGDFRGPGQIASGGL